MELHSSFSSTLTLDIVHKCSAKKTFDYRVCFASFLLEMYIQVLHELLHLMYNKTKSNELLEYLRLDEHLLDIGDDLVDYEVRV